MTTSNNHAEEEEAAPPYGDPEDGPSDNEAPNELEEPPFDDNHTHTVCPVCDLIFEMTEFRNHMLYTHPEFVAIWASALFGPTFHDGEFLSFFRGILVESDEFPNVDTDNMSYEELLQLCEDIGDHKEGIADIEEVLEKVVEADIVTEAKCPICLEEFDTNTNVVCNVEKIKTCGHMYCSDCIRKWFVENKRCPICKGDAS